jgi:putative transcriptional regulator
MGRKVAKSIPPGLYNTLPLGDDGARNYDPSAAQVPPEIDVRAIRGRLRMTQQEFAIRFGFSVNTLRHWEQGRRVPEAPTRAYLLVIDRAPEAVQRALRIA